MGRGKAERRPVTAYVAVGSNIDPETNIPEALARLQRLVRVTASSTFYRVAAVGRRGQEPFLNGAWRIETDMDARALKFDVLRRIEGEMGRARSGDRCAPREIDLDLVVYGDAAIDEPGLRVPDPDIRSRPFLAAPLLELAPDLVLADTGERLDALPGGRATDGMAPAAGLTEALRRKVPCPPPSSE